MSRYLELTYEEQDPANGSQGLDLQFPAVDPVFAGHYPGYPVLPASLVVEICCDVLINLKAIDVFAGPGWTLRDSRFAGAIKPGDVVSVRIVADGDTGSVAMHVAGQSVAELRFVRNERAMPLTVIDTGPVTLEPASGFLPQRYPLMAVDRVGVAEDGLSGVARKMVSYGDYVFRNFTPEASQGAEPVYPLGGVIEGIEQSAAAVLSRQWDFGDPSRVVLIGALRGVHFRGVARPGDVISFATRIEVLTDRLATLSGQARTDGGLLVSIDKIVVIRLDKTP